MTEIEIRARGSRWIAEQIAMDILEPDTARDWDIRFARLAQQVMAPHLSRDSRVDLADLLPDRDAYLDAMLGGARDEE